MMHNICCSHAISVSTCKIDHVKNWGDNTGHIREQSELILVGHRDKIQICKKETPDLNVSRTMEIKLTQLKLCKFLNKELKPTLNCQAVEGQSRKHWAC